MKRLDYAAPLLIISCFIKEDVLSTSPVSEEIGIDAGNSWWR